VGFHSALSDAADWAARSFHPDWILCKALRSGIGLHHGRLPRSLGQFVVRAFNDEKLRFLICTSTLIEGVNTKAKNVIILDNVIAREKYDYFTFNNIKGRSGRMFEHFIGRVFLFHSPPQEELPFVDFPLFTQGSDTPESILVQMDDDDLSESAKARVEKFKSQDLLPLEIRVRRTTLKHSHLIQINLELPETS
jgi:superfamily II helicase